MVDTDKHLPPLLTPDGARVELHMRLWETADTMGWWMPAPEATQYCPAPLRTMTAFPIHASKIGWRILSSTASTATVSIGPHC